MPEQLEKLYQQFNLGKTNAVTVMTGYLTVLLDRNGQPISLMDLATAAHREEREKKKSVMEQLKSQPKAEHKKTAPKKSAEREI